MAWLVRLKLNFGVKYEVLNEKEATKILRILYSCVSILWLSCDFGVFSLAYLLVLAYARFPMVFPVAMNA